MQDSIAFSQSLQDQQAIVQQVFETMADLYPIPVEQNRAFEGDDTVASSLSFSAPSQGCILVECSPDLAFTFTSRLMSIRRPSAVDEDVADSIRELANMIGGNLKGLMPEETCVSIPHLVDKEEREKLYARSRVLSRLCFRVNEQNKEHLCAITLMD